MKNKIAKIALLSTAIVSLAGIEAYAASTNWNVSLWGKRRAFTEHVEKLAELVSEKTNGEFTMNISYGGLSKNKENLDGISIGAFEMAQFCAGYHRDKNPTITVLELPFLGVSTLEEEVKVANAVYDHPAVKKDLARWNAVLFMTSPMPQYNLAGVGDAPSGLESFDGMRVRATGGLGNAFETIGAVPTSVTATEAYTALESGVVDAVSFAQHAHLAFRTIDIAKWWTTNLNPGTVNCPVVVNSDAYEALPDAHREALDSSKEEAIQHYLDNYGKLLEKWEGILKEKGVQKVEFTDEQIAAFKEKAATPVREAWMKEMNAAGVPAEELYQLVNDTLGK
ncbi:MAG: C4-dicarboxylate TRAP transporter substrate-binding protein [Rhizobiaceae bacterium]|jgi:TRAP-type C4-dicarboxylate transport system substrate-binding protein|nr:C4-dicarboxylate TRAP transporter substrate-binding protein [Rhizobiaceae bacterium]